MIPRNSIWVNLVAVRALEVTELVSIKSFGDFNGLWLFWNLKLILFQVFQHQTFDHLVSRAPLWLLWLSLSMLFRTDFSSRTANCILQVLWRSAWRRWPNFRVDSEVNEFLVIEFAHIGRRKTCRLLISHNFT